ncbi:MAG: histidine phosphatase family protein [Actinomycetota bacterium]
MALLRYVSHPEVVIDGDVPVARWGLTDRGRTRAEALAGQPWFASAGLVVSSDEVKAVETAAVIEARHGLVAEVRPGTGEIDRSATGFLPEPVYGEVSSAFFANPEDSPHGWERAVDGQTRIRTELADLLADGPADVVVIGHGGVGTLLWCHLAGLAIDQRHDQPHPGHWWTYDRAAGDAVHGWWPIDATEPPTGRTDRSM